MVVMSVLGNLEMKLKKKLHPEYYTRMPESPAMISSKDIKI